MRIAGLIFVCSFCPLMISSQTIWPEPGTTPTGGWITTEWHQENPYNAFCPYDSANGGKSLVGCLGLCIAQIVNYHRPASITPFSNEDDYWSEINNFKLSLDQDNHTYGAADWNDLNAFLHSAPFPVQSEESAAKLAFLCGAAIHTSYSALFSNTPDNFILSALQNRCGFAYARWQDASADMLRALKLNMQDSLPAIIIFTRNGDSPHAMIADGFDEQGPEAVDDLYHLHYGGTHDQAFSFWANLTSYARLDPPLAGGFNQIRKAIVDISARPIKPTAEFTAAVTKGYAPLTVVFSDCSFGSVTQCEWDFGDGSEKATGNIVSHIYKTPGIYSVTLTAINDSHSSTLTKTDFITITANPYPFEAAASHGFTAMSNSYGNKLAWVDIDRDNSFELFTESYPIGGIFRHPLDGWSPTLYSIKWSYLPACISYTDFDSDNDVDVFVSEWKNYLYRNHQGQFSKIEQIYLPMPTHSFSCWADFDNDGDKDLLVAGTPSVLCVNEKGALALSGIDLPNSTRAVAYDVDNDGLVDIIFYGSSDTRLYKNTGASGFVHVATMEGADYVETGDFNNDQRADLLLTRIPSVWLYLSSAQGLQAAAWTGEMPKLTGPARFIDFNRDGFVEIMTCGQTSGPVSLYCCKNMEYQFASLEVRSGIESGDLQFADINHDLMPDLCLGKTVLLNTNRPFITRLEPPKHLGYSLTGHTARLDWEPVGDSLHSVTYNVRIGTSPGGCDVLSPLACTHSQYNGRRYLAEPGNAFLCTQKIIHLPGGTYYWSVQAIDGAGNGSGFSATSVFTIGEQTGIIHSPEDTVSGRPANHPNPFTGTTTISFSLSRSGRVRTAIYNLNGALVHTLLERDMAAGEQQVAWKGDTQEGRPVGSGIYLCVVQCDEKCHTLKIALIR